MSELGHLLEVMHRAGRGFDTVIAEYRIWTHHERSAAAARAAMDRDRTASVATVQAGAVGSPAATEQDDASEYLVRIWRQGETRTREEHERDGEVSYTVVDGPKWWQYSPALGALTNDPQSGTTAQVGSMVQGLLDPSGLIGLLELEPRGRDVRAGRTILLAGARPRHLGHPARARTAHTDLHLLGHGADEFTLEVDEQRGAVLRVEARRKGELFASREALRIEFDQPIPPDKFIFEPPEGEAVQTMEALRPKHDVTIRQASEAASFPIFVIERIPDDWSLQIGLHPGRQRLGIKPSVVLSYRSGDGTRHLTVTQEAVSGGAGMPVSPHAPAWEDIERDGTSMRILRRTEEWPQAMVTLVRGETQIVLGSPNLEVDALLEAATKLMPARPS